MLRANDFMMWYISHDYCFYRDSQTLTFEHFCLCADQLETSTSPPPVIPRAFFDCALCPGRGEFECCVGGVGNLNRIYLFFWHNSPMSFLGFLQGLTDLQDWISPLSVNNFFKRVFKRRLKVSLRHISLWKACKVFDWRRNLSLRRGSSVLIGGAFERRFYPEGREFERANLQKFKCPGGWYWTFELIGALLLLPWFTNLDFWALLHIADVKWKKEMETRVTCNS